MAKKKVNDLVVIHNDLNLVSFKNLKKLEFNILFALITQFKNKQNEELVLGISELRELINLSSYSDHEIKVFIDTLARKLVSSVIRFDDNDEYIYFTLFEYLKIPKDTSKLYIRGKIHEKFIYMLNSLKNNFTIFELNEIANLSSSYSQTLYRLLKQYRKTGYLRVEIETFKNLLDIPASYKSASDIDKRVIKPALKELGEERNLFNGKRTLFKNLEFEKEKTSGRGRGGKISAYIFRFTPEEKGKCENKKVSKKTSVKKPKQKNSVELKIHPLTGEKIDKFIGYRSLHLRVKDQRFDRVNTLTIMDGVLNEDGSVLIKVLNKDDNHKNIMKFDSLAIWENYFNKHKVN